MSKFMRQFVICIKTYISGINIIVYAHSEQIKKPASNNLSLWEQAKPKSLSRMAKICD
jgi:hypothetical protein